MRISSGEQGFLSSKLLVFHHLFPPASIGCPSKLRVVHASVPSRAGSGLIPFHFQKVPHEDTSAHIVATICHSVTMKSAMPVRMIQSRAAVRGRIAGGLDPGIRRDFNSPMPFSLASIETLSLVTGADPKVRRPKVVQKVLHSLCFTVVTKSVKKFTF
jgi:hypothetical protein